MATRPIFIPTPFNRFNRLVDVIDVDFVWNKGLNPIQKKKNIREIHRMGESHGLENILEVSTKSDNPLGKNLSAFNLLVDTEDHGSVPLECVYQGSKVFQFGGPYTDLYTVSSRESKRDPRLQTSGELIGYRFEGRNWDVYPISGFYDWLYLGVLEKNPDLGNQLLQFDGFTDIEFTPGKTKNCQARACALYVSMRLKERKILKENSQRIPKTESGTNFIPITPHHEKFIA